ncbi:rho GDP-dissociation inhibitor 1-like [Macadamia integrifolia]|uniref:rho GDP-dissociation inhibitor 1-like n=1 Tax=Macadamia integrifolia TaxID=60698 RepID=UPI001C52E8C5|nr:rho GDP-dissociation inhibitor 1-like [Macadamia integrifolia]
MSLAVGAVSSSKKMGFDENKDGEGKRRVTDASLPPPSPTPTEAALRGVGGGGGEGEKYNRQMSETSLYATEEEEDEEDGKLELGPQCSLKEQLEKDKDDESLRRWKEQLLGSVDLDSVGETLEPDVKILSLSILSPDRPELILPIPEGGNPKGLWFTLKEGSRYSLKFSFKVSNNIVSGLKYTNTVWKTAVKVDSAKEMLGTFSPQAEPYTHEMPEETTPSGIFARGQYSAKTKFVDDDNKSYLTINYTFDIRKEWPST